MMAIKMVVVCFLAVVFSLKPVNLICLFTIYYLLVATFGSLVMSFPYLRLKNSVTSIRASFVVVSKLFTQTVANSLFSAFPYHRFGKFN